MGNYYYYYYCHYYYYYYPGNAYAKCREGADRDKDAEKRHRLRNRAMKLGGLSQGEVELLCPGGAADQPRASNARRLRRTKKKRGGAFAASSRGADDAAFGGHDSPSSEGRV